MTLAIRRTDTDCLVLAVSGRLDAEHAGELAREVDDELRRGHHAIALDLADCGFVSSAGLRVLFEIRRAAQGVGGSCLIRAASEQVRKVLDLTKLIAALPGSGRPPKLLRATPSAPAAGRGGCGERPCSGSSASRLDDLPLPLAGRLIGSTAALEGTMPKGPRPRPSPRESVAIGLAAFSPMEPAPRTPQAKCSPPAAPPFIAARSPSQRLITSLPRVISCRKWMWRPGWCGQGLPAGRGGIRGRPMRPMLCAEHLAAALFGRPRPTRSPSWPSLGEVHGLVGAELIRPLAAATAADRPRASAHSATARWISFSQAGARAADGEARRWPWPPAGPAAGPLAETFLRDRSAAAGAPWPSFHATILPLRPVAKRPAPATWPPPSATSPPPEPLGLLRLLADPEPVLGCGRSAACRGRCWFAPLAIGGAGT